MRYLFALIICILPVSVIAQEWEDRQTFNPDAGGTMLRVISSTDTALFAPFIADFVSQNPKISVEYLVTGTADLDLRFREDPSAFDISISSAMDLQLRLANDGFALPLEGLSHPSWAQWRNSLFAFTSEPAAIVINREAFHGQKTPQSRQDLIEALRARPDFFRGRVGTYDVRKSALGYLFATQDARTSETFWRLMEVMGGLEAALYCCSGNMIDDLTDGTIAVAYNVLGSYASARIESLDTLEIILPSDFPTIMMRTALVAKESQVPTVARSFVQHLLDQQLKGSNGRLLLPTLQANGNDGNTISLDPALMTFLDSLKREKFLSEWEDAVIQN